MKKTIFSILLFAALLVPQLGFAALQTDKACGAYVSDNVANLFPTHFCNLGDAVMNIVRILLAFISMIALVYIIIAGYKYVTSAGNEESAKSARKAITNAVIGLVVAVFSYTIIAVISSTLGTSTSSTTGGPVLKPIAAAKENLRIAIMPSTNDTFAPFYVKINASLADLKTVCPEATDSSTVQADGYVKAIYPDKTRESFVLPKAVLDVLGDQVSGTLTQVSHANAGIQSDTNLIVGVTYQIGSCYVTIEKGTEEDTPERQIHGSDLLGR